MTGWVDPRPNDFSTEGLRARFKSLEDWLRDPTFNKGIHIGNGVPATYDDSTGVAAPAATTPIDADTFDAIDGDLSDLQDDLDELNNVTLPALQQEVDDILPITETKIGDDEISTPKLKAEAVTADKIAANTITANQIAADTITANEIAADTITSNEMTADAITARELAALEMEVGKHIESSDYDGTDVATGDATSGWRIEGNGDAEFNDVRVRGAVTATEMHGISTTNLLANGDFEVDTSGWAAGPGTTISRSTATAHSGSASLRLAGANAVSTYTEVACDNEDILHFQAWVRHDDVGLDNTVMLDAIVYDGSNTPIFLTGRIGSEIAVTNWTMIEAYIAIPAQADIGTAAKVRFTISGFASSLPIYLFVDDVVCGVAPMLEMPYMTTHGDSTRRRTLVTPGVVGFDAGSAHQFGIQTFESESQNELRLMGPFDGTPKAAEVRLALNYVSGNTEALINADEIYLGITAPNLMGQWVPWTPTYTNLTIGNGTVQARYMLIGKTCFVRWTLTLGTTTNISGGVGVNLPFTAAHTTGYQAMPMTMVDSGTRNWVGSTRVAANSTLCQLLHPESGALGFVNATNPFTWTNGDIMAFSGVYEIA